MLLDGFVGVKSWDLGGNGKWAGEKPKGTVFIKFFYHYRVPSGKIVYHRTIGQASGTYRVPSCTIVLIGLH